MMNIFELSNIKYAYPDNTVALNDVSFNIALGEQVVILGANGSGKSTLLSILGGLIYVDSGIIKAFGESLNEDILNQPDFRKYFRQNIGFIFQDSDIQLFCPTVYDEIAFGPLQLGIPKDEVIKRTNDVINLLGISNLKGRSPVGLSGGEKKKVAIGSVLSINPSVLIFDEPTSGLDPRSQVWLIELLNELKKTGKTIITATHDLSIVEDISMRAIVLGEDHTLLVDDTAGKVLDDKDTLLKANLIHEHTHTHGNLRHIHAHGHFLGHLHHNKT
ncbi:MAG: ABC transporter ATP-binding protein [Actinobacteria bacterium]|nr:ABC transporter ATP-binding protein [Actinomycetota bacterium]